MEFSVSDRGDAIEMVVTGPWTAETSAVAEAGGIDRLVLNYALGFNEPSLTFLEGLQVRDLVVLDPRLLDLEPIYSLAPQLRSLQLTVDPSVRLDLGRLVGLEHLTAAWPQVQGTIDKLPGLLTAHLRSYQRSDLVPLSGSPNLQALVMKDRPKVQSLVGLDALPGLRQLEIYLAKDLADIKHLERGVNIERLALESCRKVASLDPLAACSRVRTLNLSECGDLESLDPIRNLTQLEKLWLFGSTRIRDNDLSPIASLPRLRELRMQSRRSYVPQVEALKAHLESASEA